MSQRDIEMKSKIKTLATIHNALEWQRVAEQFTYCIDALEISAHDSDSDSLVDALEDAFQRALGVDVL